MGLECNIYQKFSAESLILTKMDRLSITQCIKIIRTYYQNDDSATGTYRALRVDYGLHNRRTAQAIDKIGVVTNIECPVRLRFTRSAENIAIVSKFECVDSPPFSEIRTVLRHFMPYFAFTSTATPI